MTYQKTRTASLLFFFIILLFPLTSTAQNQLAVASGGGVTRENPGNSLLVLDTSMGEIVVELFPEEAPEAVSNFLGLAEGTKAFTDPVSGEQVTRPFFDGQIFHRVIDGFMIQTGSPTGLADGDPGYEFEIEVNARSLGLDKIPAIEENGTPHPYLGIHDNREFQQQVLAPLYQEMGINSNADLEARVDEVYEKIRSLTVMDVNRILGYHYLDNIQSRMPVKGVLAMANAGPNTNGSQFFITLADTPWLTGKFTVFGKVRSGMDVAESIGKVRVNTQDRPFENVALRSVRRVPE